jgi:signal transduction histidine kinase
MSFGCVGLVLIGNILNITDKKALYILFANIFLVIGLVFYFLNSHGITSLNPFFPNGLVVGALVNVLAFTIAIGYLQYSERKEKQLLKVQIAEREKEFIEDKFRVQEEERQRIARDLHDDLGALLAMIRLKVENVEGKLDHVNGPIRENIAESVRLLDKATKEVRFIAHELLPEELGQKRFSTLVEELFLNLENQEKIRFHNNIGELPILPTHVKANLFRIIKELLNNIFKHSGATDGELELFYDEEDVEIKLIVADNGRGFDLEQVKSGKKGMGLNNLESRVFFLNGTYEISSGPQGTTILICVPYKVNEYERGQQNNTGSHRG